MTSLTLLPLLLVFYIQGALGKSYIELQFIQYTSTCKEDINNNNCDPMFTFCLDKPKAQYSINSCFYGSTGESARYSDTLNINFGAYIGSDRIPNPWIVPIDYMEPTIMLVIRLRDYDYFGDDHLATWSIVLTEPVYPSKDVAIWASRQTNSGDYRISFKVRVYCDANSYSSSCSVTCKAQDTTTGHYTCNQATGSKICMPGWKGDNCDQDINECTQTVGLCKNNGTCENVDGDYNCRCLSGYQGKDCSVVKTACDSSPCLNNGICSSNSPTSYTCKCTAFFKGDNCSTHQDPCLASPCQNGGLCTSNLNLTKYWCNCTYPYNGTDCESFAANWTTSTTVKVNVSSQSNVSSTSLFANATTTKSPESNTTNINPANLSAVITTIISPLSNETNKNSANSSLVVTTTEPIVKAGEETPTRSKGSEAGGFPIWIIILICVIAFVLIIILLIIGLIWRHRRRQELRSSKKPPSFYNSMYNGINVKPVGERNNVVVPTTPTEDVLFNPIKPACSLALNESQTQGDSHYATMDEDGYVKPHNLVHPSMKERALSNEYDDFNNLALPLPPSLQAFEEHDEEPQYEDLDALRIKTNSLPDKETNDEEQEVPVNVKMRKGNYLDMPRNAPKTLPRGAENVFTFLVPDELEHVTIPKSKPPSPIQFTEEDEIHPPVRQTVPSNNPPNNFRSSDVSQQSYIEEPEYQPESDPFTDTMISKEIDVSDACLPDVPNHGYDVTNPLFYKLDFRQKANEKVTYDNPKSLKIFPESELDTPMVTTRSPPPPIAPKPHGADKTLNNPLYFQNALFSQNNSSKEKHTEEDVAPSKTDNNSNRSIDMRNSMSEQHEGLPDVAGKDYDVTNPLFYKLDFRQKEIEEVTYDNHTALKTRPESELDTPVSTLTRSPPPTVAPKPHGADKTLNNPLYFQNALFSQDNSSKEKQIEDVSPPRTDNNSNGTIDMRNSMSEHEGLPDVAGKDYDVTNPLFYKLDFRQKEIEEVLYDNHTALKTRPESELDTPVSTLTRSPPPPVAPKPHGADKTLNNPLYFQNALFSQDNSSKEKQNEDVPPPRTDENSNATMDIKDSMMEVTDGDDQPMKQDVPNSLFYKLDFKKNEIEEVVYDNHTSIKISPESQLETPVSTLRRSPPPVAVKPIFLNEDNKELGNDDQVEDNPPLEINEVSQPTDDGDSTSKPFQGLFIQDPKFSFI